MNHRRNLKIWGLALVAAFALSVVASANAMAAAHFHTSGTGELKGVQTGNQVFKTGGGEVTCTEAKASGKVTELETTNLELTIEYKNCSAFGFAEAAITPVTVLLHANGEVDILNEPKITVPLGFCSVTIPKQSGLKSVSFGNTAGKLDVWFEVSGIKSKGSGGGCGGENSTGTLNGHLLLELIGGTLEWVKE